METNYQLLYQKAVLQLVDLKEDLRIANAKLGGDHYTVGASREGKIDRQRKALKSLNRRVRVQRLQLRKLNELERGLRADEWTALKAEYSHELEADVWDLED